MNDDAIATTAPATPAATPAAASDATRLPQLLAGCLVLLALATLGGMYALWPGAPTPLQETRSPLAGSLQAVVTAKDAEECRSPQASGCEIVHVRVTSGSRAGEEGWFTIGEDAAQVTLGTGDRVIVARNELPDGAEAGAFAMDPYSFVDYERRPPMLWLLAGFAVLVIVAGGLQGMRAMVGLGLSALVLMLFIVPAVLAGKPPVLVALVGAMAIMLITIPLAHGVGYKSVAACCGTAGSLLLTISLATIFADLAHLTGFTSEEAVYLQAQYGQISLQGLMLAGVVIGALGVLDDVTVSQSSTVFALQKADPSQSFAQLFRGAIDVGRDHLTATVNTLVLAYAGASLPVLLIFNVGGVTASEALNNQAVAEQVVATLVGSVGLIAAVPLTTLIAALLAARLSDEQLGRVQAHAHAHSHSH